MASQVKAILIDHRNGAGECSCHHKSEIGRSLIIFCHTCCYIPLAQFFAALYNPEGTARLTP